MPVITHRPFVVFQSSLALLILAQCEKNQAVAENQPVQIPTAVQIQLEERVADSKKVEPPTPSKTEHGSESVSQAQILGEWVYVREAPAVTNTQKLVFKENGVFEHQLINEFKMPILKSKSGTVISPGKWIIDKGKVQAEYKILFGNYLESDPPQKFQVIFKDSDSIQIQYDDGSKSDDIYTRVSASKIANNESTDNGSTLMKSGDANAANEVKPEVPLPELTSEEFGRFELNMGILRNELERGRIYQLIGNIIQVGPNYIQIDDGNSDSFKANPYGVIKVSAEFLENFPGMRGDPIGFLAEFVGYNNFSSVTGRSLRLAVFNASHSSSLSGETIKVIDRDLAQKVVTMIPAKVQEDQKMADEGKPQLKPEKALPELTYDQFNSREMVVDLKGQNLEKDKLYQVVGSITQFGSDFIKIVDGNSDWDEADPYASVKVNREFMDDFPGEGGDKVRFLAEFTGYSSFTNDLGNNIRLANFKASYYSSWDGSQIKVIDKDLAKRAIAILQPPTATNQKKAEESKDKSMTAGVSEPMQSGQSKGEEADSVKIKVAELKGELAVINSKIDVERKRWKEASDLINAITNNGTQPVIRNSPEHVRMYEAQVIMKDVEAKAPGLKEQKTKIEETLKALE